MMSKDAETLAVKCYENIVAKVYFLKLLHKC